MNQQRSRAANLTPIDKLKEKATAAAMKKQYNVFDFYRPGHRASVRHWTGRS